MSRSQKRDEQEVASGHAHKGAPQISDDYGATSRQRTIGVGVALYLVSIAVGLATIPTVLRFQTARLSELGTG